MTDANRTTEQRISDERLNDLARGTMSPDTFASIPGDIQKALRELQLARKSIEAHVMGVVGGRK